MASANSPPLQFISPFNLTSSAPTPSIQTRGVTSANDDDDSDGMTAPSPRQPGSINQLSHFPISRVKRIIKEDCDVDKIANDAVVAVALATEAFVEYFLQHTHEYTKRDKRKTVTYKDMSNTVREVDQLQFLQDVLPPLVPVREALEKRQSALSGPKKKKAPAVNAAENADLSQNTQGSDNHDGTKAEDNQDDDDSLSDESSDS